MRFLFDFRLAAISLVAAFSLPVPVLAGSQLLKEVPAATFNPRSEPADVALLAGAAQVASQQQGWVWAVGSTPDRFTVTKREGPRSVTLMVLQGPAGYRLNHLASQGMDYERVIDNSKIKEPMPGGCFAHCMRVWQETQKQLALQAVYVERIDETYYDWVTPLARQLQLAGNAALAQTWADVSAANLLRSDGELISLPILDKAAHAAAPALGWQRLSPTQPGTLRLIRAEGERSATVQLAQRGQGFRLSYVDSAGLGFAKRVRQDDATMMPSPCFGICQQRLAEVQKAYQEDGRLYEQRIDNTYYQWVNALRDAIAAETDRVQP